MLAVPTSIAKNTAAEFRSPAIYCVSLISALNCRLASDRLMHVEVREQAASVCVCVHQSGPSHLFLNLSPHNPSIYHQLQPKRLALITVWLPTLTPLWIFVKLLLPSKSSAFTFVHVQLFFLFFSSLKTLSKSRKSFIPLAVSLLCDPDVGGKAPVPRAGPGDSLLIRLFLPDKQSEFI